jgi:hypothetical protein
METKENTVYIYSSYTPAQRKAMQKYREVNKEELNKRQKQYYHAKKANDPDYMEKLRVQARERYYRKKELKKLSNLSDGENIKIVVSNL